MTNKLLKGSEVAALLNISPSKVYTLMRKEEIPTVRIGRSVRVRQEDLDKYITESVHPGNKFLDVLPGSKVCRNAENLR